jgi:hypothetical protein
MFSTNPLASRGGNSIKTEESKEDASLAEQTPERHLEELRGGTGLP